MPRQSVYLVTNPEVPDLTILDQLATRPPLGAVVLVYQRFDDPLMDEGPQYERCFPTWTAAHAWAEANPVVPVALDDIEYVIEDGRPRVLKRTQGEY